MGVPHGKFEDHCIGIRDLNSTGPRGQGAIFFHNSHRFRVENYSEDNKNVEGYSEGKTMHYDLFYVELPQYHGL